MATNAVQIKEVGKWRKMQQARENGNGSESTKIEVESGENFPLMVSEGRGNCECFSCRALSSY